MPYSSTPIAVPIEGVCDWSRVAIGETLRARAKTWPDKVAIRGEGQSFTFAQADRRVDEMALGLGSIGVGRGDQVAIWMTNCPSWVLCWWACVRLGATAVAVNTRFKPDEVEYILHQSNAKVLIMMERYWNIDYSGMIQAMVPELAVSGDGELQSSKLPDLRAVVLWNDAKAPGTRCLDDITAAGRKALASGYALPAEHPEDPVIIVYTSGTTGHPKGAMHNHVLLRNCVNMAREMHVETDDVVLGHMPFYHVAGAFAAISLALLKGCRLVTLAHWIPEEALDVIEQEGVTIFGGIPTHFIDCIDTLDRNPRAIRMKSAWIGGATVTPAVAQAALDCLGLEAIQAVYGMTETTAMTTLSEFDAPMEVFCENKGKPVGEFEVKVCDAETGEVRLPNVDGEVWVRGHLVMMGYYRNQAATEEVMTGDGWFKTGDIGVVDEEGYLQITGRLKEMFIVGGSNTYPAEIERVIQTFPAAKQAVVVGVPDRRLGEVGFAFVELHEGQSATTSKLLEFCRCEMADYKVPRYVEFVTEFPRTSTGKLQKYLLADRARAKLGMEP